MEPSRVPAWKRLGLKLKFANDGPFEGGSPAGNESAPRKHTRGSANSNLTENGDDQLRNKRRRIDSSNLVNDIGSSNSTSKSSTRFPNGQTDLANGKKLSETPNTNNRLQKVKKRVSFSSDSKSVDGGVDSLPSKPQNTAIPKKTKSQNSGKPTRKSQNSLEYLDYFYRDRDSWKFSKNREVWLVKHVFSTTDIPQSYNLALAHYIHSLQSPKNRSRLIDELQSSLSTSQTPSENRESTNETSGEPNLENSAIDDPNEPNRRKFLESLQAQNHDEQDEHYLDWVKSQRRECLLLWSLGAPLAPPKPVEELPITPSDKTISSGITPTKRKQSKLRVNAPSYSSSSSSSSSDESSDSESNEDADVTTRLSVEKKELSKSTPESDELTSSSGDDDDDSESASEFGSDSSSDENEAAHSTKSQ